VRRKLRRSRHKIAGARCTSIPLDTLLWHCCCSPDLVDDWKSSKTCRAYGPIRLDYLAGFLCLSNASKRYFELLRRPGTEKCCRSLAGTPAHGICVQRSVQKRSNWAKAGAGKHCLLVPEEHWADIGTMNIGVAIRTGLEPARLVFSAQNVRASLWIRGREMAELADRVYVGPN
jgi:hypothetical protein